MLPDKMFNVTVIILCVCSCLPTAFCRRRPVSLPKQTTPRNAPSDSIRNTDYITAFPEPPICGKSNASFTKVVGGVDAKLGNFPWMALLGYQNDDFSNPSWDCGGSLISHHHVLTAAHCIHNKDNLNVVRLGDLDFDRDDDGADPIDVHVKRTIQHEKYSRNSFNYDIGLVILEEEVKFTDFIKPICMPLPTELRTNLFVDYNPYVAGWGYNEFPGFGHVEFRNGDSRKSHLQIAQLPVQDNAYCKKAYERYAGLVTVDTSVMCVGSKNGGKNSCRGDSGGPLMHTHRSQNNRMIYIYQIGVVSIALKCAEAGYPSIYTRVSHYMPWLQKHILGKAE